MQQKSKSRLTLFGKLAVLAFLAGIGYLLFFIASNILTILGVAFVAMTIWPLLYAAVRTRRAYTGLRGHLYLEGRKEVKKFIDRPVHAPVDGPDWRVNEYLGKILEACDQLFHPKQTNIWEADIAMYLTVVAKRNWLNTETLLADGWEPGSSETVGDCVIKLLNYQVQLNQADAGKSTEGPLRTVNAKKIYTEIKERFPYKKTAWDYILTYYFGWIVF